MGRTVRSRRRRRRNRNIAIGVALATVVALGAGLAGVALAQSRAASQEAADLAAEEYLDRIDAEREAAEAAEAVAAQEAWDAGLIPIDRPTDRPLTVALYGDSVTYGMDATAEENTWREIFRRGISQLGPVDLLLRAWPGARVSDMASSVVPRPGIDLSIVALGLNDGFKQTPLDEFARDYTAQLDGILSASPDTTLVCLGLWQDTRTAQYGPYDDEIERQCVERGGHFIDLSNGFLVGTTHGPPDQTSAFDDLKTDSTHPNDFGMRVLAFRVMERMPSLVPELVVPDGIVALDPSKAPS